jgi:hypothetical protein
MHKRVDVNRMVICFRKPLSEICIPRQAITYFPRALKTTITAELAHRSLARTLCFPLLALTTRTLDGLGFFSQRSCRVACNIGVVAVPWTGILLTG